MKVCHLSSVHPIETRIFHKECKSLQEHGYDVSLVIRAKNDQVIDGIKVIAVKDYPSRIKRIIFASLDVLSKAKLVDADIFHFHDPELILIGILLRLSGKKVIYDVHEDLPKQILSKHWIAPSIRRIIALLADWVEVLSVRYFFSAVVVAEPSVVVRFSIDKAVLVQNFPKFSELSTMNFSSYVTRPLNITYIGGITLIRGVLEMLNSLAFVQEKSVKLILAGTFDPPELQNQAEQHEYWNQVDYRGWLNRTEICKLLSESRIGLVILHPVPNYLEAYPVKLFEYMAAGLPVIVSNFPLWRKIVEDAQCGLLVDPLNPMEIAKAIDWLIENPLEAEKMGQNGKTAVLNQYLWAHEEAKLLDLYKQLANN